MLQKFWKWYESHLTENTAIAAFLFALQLIHLYWLSVHVVLHRIAGIDLWNPTGPLEVAILLVDYTEIPALIATSLIYINDLRKKQSTLKSWLYLVFLNSQWLHIFWITDEFVVDQFSGTSQGTVLPAWLAWVAIMIDYLELPVIFETLKRAFGMLKERIFKA